MYPYKAPTLLVSKQDYADLFGEMLADALKRENAKRLVSAEFIASECVRLFGDGEHALTLFGKLMDLKQNDPELFNGSRSVKELSELV
jgi:hypothetical protein